MTINDWFVIILLVVALIVFSPLLGRYIASVLGSADSEKRSTVGDKFFLPIENRIYRICGIDQDREQRWTTYAFSLLAFSAVSIIFLYALLRLQNFLPLNPNSRQSVGSTISFNTAISYVTNTNWQTYAGESTLSMFSQAIGLAVQNFLSAAVGLSVAFALIRGLVRKSKSTIGNFWVDLTRASLRVLLPMALVLSVVFVSQGVIQNFQGSHRVTTVEGAQQVLPSGGAVASQEAIKVIGTNGGGYLAANSAHPFENPNGFTNWLQIFAMLIIPFSLAFAFGRMTGDRRQGRVIFAAMFALWILSASLAIGFEVHGNASLNDTGVTQVTNEQQVGGNLEGKESRFGSAQSALFAASTTGTSSGATNSSHDSYTPLGGMVPLVNMMLGEVSPGGVGAGLYGILIFAILTVFLAGLMVGRTPEFLGKKIQATEMKLVVLYILAVPSVVLILSAIFISVPSLRSAIGNPGPHGLTEMIYAFTSAGNNNGSAFVGLADNGFWYDTMLGLAMLVGRFLLIIPVLAIAGSLARKTPSPPSSGTFPTNTPLFVGLLLGTIVIVVGLTYFPSLALGPIVEQLGA